MTITSIATVCVNHCKAKKHCCNDWKIGTNEVVSCAQACMLRGMGSDVDKCKAAVALKIKTKGCDL